VYSGPSEGDLRGRNAARAVEGTTLVIGLRRRNTRKVVKLARALAMLDDHTRAPRPPVRRTAKLFVSN
jgi:hypothetical protein